MPEKIRSAVRGGDIAPSERYKTNPLPSCSFVPIKSDSMVNIPTKVPHEELNEEKLTGLTSDNDFDLFKSAWKKAAKVNEEVCAFI